VDASELSSAIVQSGTHLDIRNTRGTGTISILRRGVRPRAIRGARAWSGGGRRRTTVILDGEALGLERGTDGRRRDILDSRSG